MHRAAWCLIKGSEMCQKAECKIKACGINGRALWQRWSLVKKQNLMEYSWEICWKMNEEKNLLSFMYVILYMVQ